MFRLPPTTPGFKLPVYLTKFIRERIETQIARDPLLGNEIVKLVHTDDIWFCQELVEEHMDRKPDDKCFTSGLILINDAKQRLSLFNQTRSHCLRPGTVFQIDVSKPHGTVGTKSGLFAFLAWDSFPVDLRPAKEFAMEAVSNLTWNCLNEGMKA
jgi:hypothetical protein